MVYWPLWVPLVFLQLSLLRSIVSSSFIVTCSMNSICNVLFFFLFFLLVRVGVGNFLVTFVFLIASRILRIGNQDIRKKKYLSEFGEREIPQALYVVRLLLPKISHG